MVNYDFEIYDGKTFKDLCRDVVTRSDAKKIQIDMLYSDLRGLIKDQTSALNIVPQLKTLLETGIKNDEQLVKLAAIFQRLQSTQIEVSGGDLTGLSDEDKAQLLREVETIKQEIETPIENSASLK
jgi:alpha-galactosidase